MRVAFLIDKISVGGGMEYIHRQIQSRSKDECRVFAADRRECAALKLNKWGADIIHVNHLKALLQLFSNPFHCPLPLKCRRKGHVKKLQIMQNSLQFKFQAVMS